jgi:hypothetical protein
MNVALWAGIRRLAEMEKLSDQAISHRLHYSRYMVTRALKRDQPPTRQAWRWSGGILDPHKAKIDTLLAKNPELSGERIREEITRDADSYRGSTIVIRRYLQTVRPHTTARVPGSPL